MPTDSVELLRELVEIPSGTSDISGVNLVQSKIERELKALGFTVTLESKEKGAKLLVATLKGASPQFITFVVHADTVFDAESKFEGFSLSADKKSATGPGVIDDKGGIVVALRGIENYLKNLDGKPSPYSLRFVSSPSEETGSPGLHADLKTIGANSALILGFEPALQDGDIIESRRGGRWYHIKVEGKEAHAGRGHKDGINACHELSLKAAALQELTDYKKNMTVSIGHIAGGKDKFNIICGSAEAKIDARFSDFKTGDALDKKIHQILSKPKVKSAATGEWAKTSFETVDNCPPFAANKKSQVISKEYLKIVGQIENRKIKSTASGGSADVNYMSRPEALILDGLGPIGSGMHTTKETIILDSLRTRSEALAAFLSTAPKFLK